MSIEKSGSAEMGIDMYSRNDIEVIINGKRYTLSGYEGEEYMQRVAAFINNKIGELKQQDFYRTLDTEMRNVLLQINIADEYFKIKKQLSETESDSDAKSNELYSLKHEIINLQTKLSASLKQIEELKKENIEEQKKNVKLETELSQTKRKGKEKD